MVLGALLHAIAPNSMPSRNLFPPASKFKPDRDMPDLSNKIILVTGGNTGIGYETIKYLLRKNAKVYMGARSASRAAAAIKALKAETGKTAIFLELDLADLRSVRKAATTYGTLESQLDIAILNAGIMGTPTSKLTAQGYDAHFGTNVLGHYFLVTCLMPYLEASTRKNGHRARVINYSSALTADAPGPTGIDWDTLVGGPARDAAVKKAGTFTLYGQSKLGNIFSSHIFRTMSSEIVSCTVHPGVFKSDLGRDLPRVQTMMFNLLFYPVSMGPLTALFAATVAPEEKMDGAYFVPFARYGKGDQDPRSDNKDTQEAVRAWLEKAVAGF